MLNRHDCSSSPFPCVHTVCTKHEESIVTFSEKKSILSYTTNAHPRHTDVFQQTQMPCHGSHHKPASPPAHETFRPWRVGPWGEETPTPIWFLLGPHSPSLGDQQQQDRRTTDTPSNTVSNTTTSIIDYYVHNVFSDFPNSYRVTISNSMSLFVYIRRCLRSICCTIVIFHNYTYIAR